MVKVNLLLAGRVRCQGKASSHSLCLSPLQLELVCPKLDLAPPPPVLSLSLYAASLTPFRNNNTASQHSYTSKMASKKASSNGNEAPKEGGVSQVTSLLPSLPAIRRRLTTSPLRSTSGGTPRTTTSSSSSSSVATSLTPSLTTSPKHSLVGFTQADNLFPFLQFCPSSCCSTPSSNLDCCQASQVAQFATASV